MQPPPCRLLLLSSEPSLLPSPVPAPHSFYSFCIFSCFNLKPFMQAYIDMKDCTSKFHLLGKGFVPRFLRAHCPAAFAGVSVSPRGHLCTSGIKPRCATPQKRVCGKVPVGRPGDTLSRLYRDIIPVLTGRVCEVTIIRIYSLMRNE